MGFVFTIITFYNLLKIFTVNNNYHHSGIRCYGDHFYYFIFICYLPIFRYAALINRITSIIADTPIKTIGLTSL